MGHTLASYVRDWGACAGSSLPRMSRGRARLAAAMASAVWILSVAVVPSAAAEDCTIEWSGAESSSWHDVRNWTSDSPIPRTPHRDDHVCIGTGTHLPVEHTLGTTEVASLSVSAPAPAGAVGTLVLSGGILALRGDSFVVSPSILTLLGGTMHLGGTLTGNGISLRGGEIAGGAIDAVWLQVMTDLPGRAIVDTEVRTTSWNQMSDATLGGAASLVVTGTFRLTHARLLQQPGGTGHINVTRTAKFSACPSADSVIEPPILISGSARFGCGLMRIERLQNLEPLPGGGQRWAQGAWYFDSNDGILLPGVDVRELAVRLLDLSAPHTVMSAGDGNPALRNLEVIDTETLWLNSRLDVSGPLRLRGHIHASSLGIINAAGDVTIDGAKTSVHMGGGTVRADNGAGTVRVDAGTLRCGGTISGSLRNAAWLTIHGGDCTVEGDYVQTSSGTEFHLYYRDGAIRFSELLVGGSASLSGSLEVARVVGGAMTYVPAPGESFDVLRAASVRGEHGRIREGYTIPNRRFDPEYGAAAVSLVVDATPERVANLVASPQRGAAGLTWENPGHEFSAVDAAVNEGTAPDSANATTRYAIPPENSLRFENLRDGADYTFSVRTRYYERASDYSSEFNEVVSDPVTRTLLGSAVDVATSRTTLRRGRRVAIRGLLRTATSGEPLGGRRVQLQHRYRSIGRWSASASRLTNTAGEVVFRRRPGQSVRYRLVFGGADRHLGSMSAARRVRVIRP